MPVSAVATTPVALEPLLAADAVDERARGGRLPESLRRAYGGDLAVPLRGDRPTLIANFVSTLDGVVAWGTRDAAGGGEISGFFEPDRFVMGLLRAMADVVLIGAGTLRAAPHEAWTPAYIHPGSAAAYAALRRQLKLSPQPSTVVVSASGSVDPHHPGLADPAVDPVLVTTVAGARAIAPAGLPAHVELRTLAGDRIDPIRLLDLLGARGARLILCEGGPQLFGELLAGRLVDELFLTVAPQVAGRSPGVPRLGLVERAAFGVADAPWGRLVDLRRASSHLFARYRFQGEADAHP